MAGNQVSLSKGAFALNIGLIGLIVCAALFVAFLITKVDPLIALGMSIAAVGLLLSIRYTFLPLLAAVLIVCDVIPFPKGGRLYPIFIAGCCLLSIVLSFIKNRKLPNLINSVWAPPAIYFLTMGWGYFYGAIYLKNNPGFALTEFQQTASLLFLPALLLGFDSHNKAEKLINLTLSIGLIIGIATLFQYFTGISLGGRVEQLETLGSIDTDITRATIPGKLFVLFGLFFWLSKLLASNQKPLNKFFNFLCITLLSFALLVSFGRALWASAAIGIFISALFLGRRHFLKVLILVTVLGVIGTTCIAAFSPRVYSAAVERATSVFYEGASSSSYGWRVTENFYASQAVAKNPLLGIGLGGEYKPPLVTSTLFPSQTSYIHNSYYFTQLKTGYLGIFLLLTFSISVFINATKGIKQEEDAQHRITIAAIFSTLVAIAILSATQPEIISFSSIAYISIILALAHAIQTRKMLLNTASR